MPTIKNECDMRIIHGNIAALRYAYEHGYDTIYNTHRVYSTLNLLKYLYEEIECINMSRFNKFRYMLVYYVDYMGILKYFIKQDPSKRHPYLRTVTHQHLDVYKYMVEVSGRSTRNALLPGIIPLELNTYITEKFNEPNYAYMPTHDLEI